MLCLDLEVELTLNLLWYLQSTSNYLLKNKIWGTWFIKNWGAFFRGEEIKEFILLLENSVKFLKMWIFEVFKLGTLIIYLWWNFSRRNFLDIRQGSKFLCGSRYSFWQLLKTLSFSFIQSLIIFYISCDF